MTLYVRLLGECKWDKMRINSSNIFDALEIPLEICKYEYLSGDGYQVTEIKLNAFKKSCKNLRWVNI
jgi:hypothetical protein